MKVRMAVNCLKYFDDPTFSSRFRDAIEWRVLSSCISLRLVRFHGIRSKTVVGWPTNRLLPIDRLTYRSIIWIYGHDPVIKILIFTAEDGADSSTTKGLSVLVSICFKSGLKTIKGDCNVYLIDTNPLLYLFRIKWLISSVNLRGCWQKKLFLNTIFKTIHMISANVSSDS